MPEQFTITCALFAGYIVVHIHYLKAARVMGLQSSNPELLRQNLISPDGQKERYLITVIYYSRAKVVKMGIFQFGFSQL
jgi:hypothetical protein